MRTVGQTLGKMRRMAAEFQGQFMEAMREVEREADLESVKKEFQAINEQAKIDTSFDPVGMVRDDMTKAVATSTGAAEAAASQPAEPEIGASGIALAGPAPAEAVASEPAEPEIGASEIALAGPAPAEAAAPAEMEAEPEAPAARRSAAE